MANVWAKIQTTFGERQTLNNFLKKLFPALKDKRYRIDTLSESKFSISVSSVKFNDGGNYTCSHYGDQIKEKIVEVTVLGKYYLTSFFLLSFHIFTRDGIRL